MNNPNEAILLTDDGHPIGEIVVTDNASLDPKVPGPTSDENREASLRSLALELTGELDPDTAVTDLFPEYTDAEKRKRAMVICVADGGTVAEAAKAVKVPERTVARWAYDFRWDRLVRQEIAARQTQSVMELARLRTSHRTKIVKEQLDQAKELRDAAMDKLRTGDTSIKSATEAWAAAAKVEHTLTGLSETGTIAGVGDQDQDEQKGAGGKQPLVAIMVGGGLPPVRRSP